MDKQFKVNQINSALDNWTLRAAFGSAIGTCEMSRDEALQRFNALEIGETLIDEDGDIWERIA